jgi:predicted O-methyltransferase YrrM
LRYGAFGRYLTIARNIPGWTWGDEAVALMRTAYALPADAVIVEVGSFLGKSTVMLAGARKLRGSGRVCCIDPFDGSGDGHSVPFYREIASQSSLSLRERFDDNLQRAGLGGWVEVHQGTADRIAAAWTCGIDLLFLDGDQSVQGARRAYDAFVSFLKPGGTLALHNSAPRAYAPGHDGHRRLAEVLPEKNFCEILCIGSTTFATKAVLRNDLLADEQTAK